MHRIYRPCKQKSFQYWKDLSKASISYNRLYYTIIILLSHVKLYHHYATRLSGEAGGKWQSAVQLLLEALRQAGSQRGPKSSRQSQDPTAKAI